MSAKIILLSDGFKIKTGIFKTKICKWANIVKISSVRINMITYDQNYLIIHFNDSSYIYIGELESGFKNFIKYIIDNFRNFNKNWYGDTENNKYDLPIVLWEKTNSNL